MSEQPFPIESNKTPEQTAEQVAQIQQIMREFRQELGALEIERNAAINNFVEEKKMKRIEEIRQSILN